MFTTVNSNKKIIEHPLASNANNSLDIDNSNLIEERLPIFKQISQLLEFSNDFFSLQLALFCLTLIISIVLTVASCIFINFSFGLSIFVGSITGILYLRLLAKSVGNLGKTSSGVSKVQLLLPVCLFILASKNELIEVLPSIIGFFLYKPAMFYYFSRS
tara:strand:- start:543 stop:1019 length:477 start_codon:yes stop_codon:yes gene_type:complete